jgi:hypothetical protein
VDLPTRLRALSQRLPRQVGEPADLIEESTLYPYYRPFCGDRCARIVDILLNGNAGGLRMLMGNTASGFGKAPALRYCPQCIVEDRISPGFAYWHRAHHLPEVFVCHIHRAFLVPAEAVIPRWTKTLVLPSNCSRELAGPIPVWQLRFSEASWDLLQVAAPPLDRQRIVATHLTALDTLGLLRRGRPDYNRIAVKMLDHYRDFIGFQHRERLLRSERAPLQWTNALLKRTDRVTHPVCHLLMLLFLHGTVRSFLDNYRAQTAAPEKPSDKIRFGSTQARATNAKLRKARRVEWDVAMETHSSVKIARKNASAAYAWLYRNDRGWLMRSNEMSNPVFKRAPRVDWTVRDRAMCEQTRAIARQLMADAPTKRLTVSRLRRALGEANTRHPAKLPQLQRQLEQLAESPHAYHARRVVEAVQHLINLKKSLTWSSVQRRAGLRTWNDALRRTALIAAHEAAQEIAVGRGTLI